MSTSSPRSVSDEQAATIAALRQQLRQLESPKVRLRQEESLGLPAVKPGRSYQVDSAVLLSALLADATQVGWAGLVGVTDWGVEAAHQAGVRLDRIIMVPGPGSQWLEVTAALIDTVAVVVVQPSARVGQRVAAQIAARLRQRQAALVAWGNWPRADVSLRLTASRWEGIEAGHGRLQARRATVAVQPRGGQPHQVELRQNRGLLVPVAAETNLRSVG